VRPRTFVASRPRLGNAPLEEMKVLTFDSLGGPLDGLVSGWASCQLIVIYLRIVPLSRQSSLSKYELKSTKQEALAYNRS
jgi:hypothetical protein